MNSTPRRRAAVSGIVSEFKVVSLRDHRVLPSDDNWALYSGRDYWKQFIETSPYFNAGVETLAVLMLNTHELIFGHAVVGVGLLDTVLYHPRETFRAAIVANAAAIILMHNLCNAAHKLCYVQRRFMCSCRLADRMLAWEPRGKACYA